MPSRIIREGILTSERVNSLSERAELFYRRLLSVVDDFGRFSANLTLLRASCYPLKLDCVKEDSIKKHLAEAADAGLIVLYTVAGKAYLELQDFRQQVRAKESKYPAPEGQTNITCIADAKHVIHTCAAHAHLDGDVVEDVEKHESPIGDSSPSADADGPAPRTNPIPYQAIVDTFNRTLTRLPKARTLTPKRRTLIRSAWQAAPERRSIEFWQALASEYEADNFTNGTGPYTNGHADWRPSIDYLLRADVVTRTFERAMDRLERGA